MYSTSRYRRRAYLYYDPYRSYYDPYYYSPAYDQNDEEYDEGYTTEQYSSVDDRELVGEISAMSIDASGSNTAGNNSGLPSWPGSKYADPDVHYDFSFPIPKPREPQIPPPPFDLNGGYVADCRGEVRNCFVVDRLRLVKEFMLPGETRNHYYSPDADQEYCRCEPLIYISVRDIANVKSGDIGGKSDIYYKVLWYRDGEWQEVQKSQITKNTLSVHYHDASAPIIPNVTGMAANTQEWKRPGAVWQDAKSKVFCKLINTTAKDVDSIELKIEVFDYDFGSSDDFLGEIKYTLHALQASSYTVQPNIVTSELQSRSDHKDKGIKGTVTFEAYLYNHRQLATFYMESPPYKAVEVYKHDIEERKLIHQRDLEEWETDEKLRQYMLLGQPIRRPEGNDLIEVSNWVKASNDRYQQWLNAVLPAPVAPIPTQKFPFTAPTLQFFGLTSGKAQVLITLDAGRNLVPSDDNGLADPYVLIELRHPSGDEAKVQRTVSWRRFATLDPAWRCQFVMFVDTKTLGNDFIIHGEVWDYDNGVDDDFMGSFDLAVNLASFIAPPLMWVPLRPMPSNPDATVTGEVNLAVAITPASMRSFPPDQVPEAEFAAFQNLAVYDYQKRMEDLDELHAHNLREHSKHMVAYQAQLTAQQALVAANSMWRPSPDQCLLNPGVWRCSNEGGFRLSVNKDGSVAWTSSTLDESDPRLVVVPLDHPMNVYAFKSVHHGFLVVDEKGLSATGATLEDAKVRGAFQASRNANGSLTLTRREYDVKSSQFVYAPIRLNTLNDIYTNNDMFRVLDRSNPVQMNILTVPAGANLLGGFSFQIKLYGNPGDSARFVLRVRPWDYATGNFAGPVLYQNESAKSVPSNFQEGNVGFEVISCPFASPVQLVSGQAYAFSVEFASNLSASNDMSALLAHCTDPFHPAFPGIMSVSTDSANTFSGFDARQTGGLLCFDANFTSNFHHLAEATRMNLSFVFMESAAEFQTHDHPEAKAETTALPLAQVRTPEEVADYLQVNLSLGSLRDVVIMSGVNADSVMVMMDTDWANLGVTDSKVLVALTELQTQMKAAHPAPAYMPAPQGADVAAGNLILLSDLVNQPSA